MTSRLDEATLVAIRTQARNPGPTGAFVNPHEAEQVKRILRRRGETWAEHVRGAPFARRALFDPVWPWLTSTDFRVLIAADKAEDDVAFTAVTTGR